MGASPQQAEALEVLREVWRVQGQGSGDLDGCETTSCKRMTDAGVGFDDFAGGASDLAAAWRDRLRREGKYNASGTTLRALVMDPEASGTAG
jgi:hypothetical protein